MDDTRPQQGETAARAGDIHMHFSRISPPFSDAVRGVVGAFEVIADQTAITNSLCSAINMAEYRAPETANTVDAFDWIAPGDTNIAAIRTTHEKIAATAYSSLAMLTQTIAAMHSAAEQVASIDEIVLGDNARRIDDVREQSSLTAQQSTTAADELAATSEEAAVQIDTFRHLAAFFS